MNESLVVDTNTTIAKFWHLLGPVIHLLQTKPGNIKVNRKAQAMLRVRYTSDRLVMCSATIPVMDDDGFRSELAKALKAIQELGQDNTGITVTTGEFLSREVGG